jgi:hypothetical protein
MKNLLEPSVKKEVLQRIEKLSPQTKALWGKMNVNQGARHMAKAFEIPIGELDPTLINPPKMPKWLMRFFLLQVKPPKGGAETFKEMNMVANNINPTDFEAEKKNLKEMLIRFCDADKYIPENKLAGKFSREDWGKLNYNHIDHHLRQFGA